MADLGTGAKCIKYTLFVFNFLFLLAGLALIIVGAVVQYQTSHGVLNGFGNTNSVNGVGIFLIVIGGIVFIVSFFGCVGAINNNSCMIITFGVLLIILLLAEVAAVIAGFTLRNKIQPIFEEQMNETLKHYLLDEGNLQAKTWNTTQETLHCCGTHGYESWRENSYWNATNSVPDQCCRNITDHCGDGKLNTDKETAKLLLVEKKCLEEVINKLTEFMIAAGAVAAAVAILEIIGIIFAFSLAHALRKDYRVV